MRRFLFSSLLLALMACGETDDADSCDPAECTEPPPSICETDGIGALTRTIITYAAEGTCVLDRCVYQALQAECPGSCAPEFDADGEPSGASCTTGP